MQHGGPYYVQHLIVLLIRIHLFIALWPSSSSSSTSDSGSEAQMLRTFLSLSASRSLHVCQRSHLLFTAEEGSSYIGSTTYLLLFLAECHL